MKRRLRILAGYSIIIAGVALLLRPTTGYAVVDEIYHYSQQHCILLQRAPLTPAPNYLSRIQTEQTEHRPHSEAARYNHAPDLGFLLPRYWPVMNWSQRVTFNHYMTAILKRRLGLAQHPAQAQDCEPDLRIRKNTPPQPPRDELAEPFAAYEAIAVMTLRHQSGEALPLTYHFARYENETAWVLEDITVHYHSLKAQNLTALQTHIRQHGLTQLERWLKTMLNRLIANPR